MRFVSIYFTYLLTDAFSLKHPEWRGHAVAMTKLSHGRKIITAVNQLAEQQGIFPGKTLADARAILPDLRDHDEPDAAREKILEKLGQWSIRFSPEVGIDLPDGIYMDVTGCAHLWGGEKAYLEYIRERFTERGYEIRLAMADSYGMAWGLCRYGGQQMYCIQGFSPSAFLALPIAALRIEPEMLDAMHTLGLFEVKQLLSIPVHALKRRFGQLLVTRIQQSMGECRIWIKTIVIPKPFEVRLPCLEPIISRQGVEIAIHRLLDDLKGLLLQQQQGLRKIRFSAYAADGKVYTLLVQMGMATLNITHVFGLLALQLEQVKTEAGLELFTLFAEHTEAYNPTQEKIWETSTGINIERLSEWMDYIIMKFGRDSVQRYLPSEHHIPEKSVVNAADLKLSSALKWLQGPVRPIHLLDPPEKIEVTAPIPDYPPMMFRHKGQLHRIIRADGPERIEQEWWVARGRHRDYYAVEDEEGKRYWLFRSGHYDEAKTYTWYLHGYLV